MLADRSFDPPLGRRRASHLPRKPPDTAASNSRLRGPLRLRLPVLAALLVTACQGWAVEPPAPHPLFARDNLVAWCIVPFDAQRRGPEARARMLYELGITRCAYDWREEHVPSFEEEILQYQRYGIEMFAFWEGHEAAFALFEKYQLRPQIWRTLAEPPEGAAEQRVAAAAQALTALAQRTRQLGCALGLYNHGGWGGEPANLVAVCQHLRSQGYGHVGIVYNFHHGHDQIDNWQAAFALMQPYLLCLNINGMRTDAQPKILPVGQGTQERRMLQVVVESGYRGPVGILDHREELDARQALELNLRGLDALAVDWQGPAGASPAPPQAPPGVELEEMCQPPSAAPSAASNPAGAPRDALPYDAAFARRLSAAADTEGDALRGAHLFASATTACLACHRVGEVGNEIGPDLTQIGAQRETLHLVESVFWPQREVLPEFVHWTIRTHDGRWLRGYKRPQPVPADLELLYDPTSGAQQSVPRDAIEEQVASGTLMPHGLLSACTPEEQRDLIRFLSVLGEADAPPTGPLQRALVRAQWQPPAEFPLQMTPLRPADWPHHTHPVNRQRLYDFYAKQADYFRGQQPAPHLLAAFPGLDGGKKGQWGNQDEKSWADERWNDTRIEGFQCGVFHGPHRVVPRGVCLRLGDQEELSACFNPDTLTYDAVWSGGFVTFSPVRHGFMDGLQLEGNLLPRPREAAPDAPCVYRGFYRYGRRVLFAYRVGDTEFLDAPWVADGQFQRLVAPVRDHPLRSWTLGGPSQWPETITTTIHPGTEQPCAIDRIDLPVDNPWRALLFCGGHDFLPNGDALVCTMQGDVWQVSGLDSGGGQPGQAHWRRFACGLHQALGLVVTETGEIYVQCRDRLVRLHDLNGDGEADFYESFCDKFATSAAGHDFICGLERDAAGRFYTASANQGLLRMSADGQDVEILATGFRNPDGLGLLPDGLVTVPCSEGDWTPASMIGAVRPAAAAALADASRPVPHFGYPGPRQGAPPDLPLVYLPRGLDNSSGGQTYVTSGLWGPLQGQLLHFSYGMGCHFLVLRDEVDGQQQGGVVPLVGDFSSGVHRGRFRPQDGQLYVTGMSGWGTYTVADGCFERVRYRGGPWQLPVGFHAHENGVLVRFARPLVAEIATRREHHFAQCWNYRYRAAYGSPEFSPSHPGTPGHDVLQIEAVHLLPDGQSLFFELPELQPVNQLHLRMRVDEGASQDLFLTLHRLDHPWPQLPGYRPRQKWIAAHPILADMAALSAAPRANPWVEPLASARSVRMEAGANLTFATPELRAAAGEPLAVTLVNPDVVPHNWALVRPGSLQRVGELANRLISEPDAHLRHYMPDTEELLAYTNIVPPGEEFTIYFTAPAEPGDYPFLCTFPGHWMVMNGVLRVD